jgi:hypothetical protein
MTLTLASDGFREKCAYARAIARKFALRLSTYTFAAASGAAGEDFCEKSTARSD